MKNIKNILLLIALAACMRSESQTFQEVKASRVVVGSVLRPNRDTIQLNARDSGTIAYKNGDLYTWTGYLWKAVGVVGGGANIYNSNGTLTGARVLDGAGYQFKIINRDNQYYISEGATGDWDDQVGSATGIMFGPSLFYFRSRQSGVGVAGIDAFGGSLIFSVAGDPDWWNGSYVAITKDSIHFRNTGKYYSFWGIPHYSGSAYKALLLDTITGRLYAGPPPSYGGAGLRTIYVAQAGGTGTAAVIALNDSTLSSKKIRDSIGLSITTAPDGALVFRNTAPATNTTSFQSIINALGAGVIAQTFDIQIGSSATFNTLFDRQIDFVSIYVSSATTLTGVKWVQTTQGVYTGDQYNGWGLYSYSGGTMTLVASTTNDANIWKGTSGTSQSVAFSSTYSASEGVYFLAALYNQSAQTTAPVLKAKISAGSATAAILTNSAKIAGYTLSNNSLPASLAISTLTDNPVYYWSSVY